MPTCPVYRNQSCLLKSLFTKNFNSKLFDLEISNYTNDCNGDIAICTFHPVKEPEPVQEAQVQEEVSPVVEEIIPTTKVSIHKCDNPYLVKADVLMYPANNILTIDDPLLHRMSRGLIQEECDKIGKPIKMGSVYVTSNGGEQSKVQPRQIYHAVVAGESRLVNEQDIKLATRKCLHVANSLKVKNIVMLPTDCGTHDIADTARVQLSAIKTYLTTEKDCQIRNIFVVMEDKESYEVFEEYYQRIF
jgi:O-acetyl-ADP-ribose deacetylase (regulator of RNase III)